MIKALVCYNFTEIMLVGININNELSLEDRANILQTANILVSREWCSQYEKPLENDSFGLDLKRIAALP